jgi:molecular chaperone DnaK
VAYAVGIDLGTTNTVVAAVRDGAATTLADAEGRRLLPSVVAFSPSGAVVVGQAAVERRLIDSGNTVYSVKRLIGRPWQVPEVQLARDKFPFELREGPKGSTQVVARGEAFSLPEISAFVLRRARAIAEEALGGPVARAVITVPANFNDLQRAATKTAGRLADLEVLRILNEPTAAALAYGSTGQAHERVAVYDLGGGTFDVTLLDLAGDVFEVLATAGDSSLGGDDVDVAVAERMAEQLLESHRFDALAQTAAFGRLRLAAEQLKRELSQRDDASVTLDDLVPGARGAPTRWSFRMTRSELESIALPLVDRSFQVCARALEAAGAAPRDVDRVILVGGSTRMPLVARRVEQFFGRRPVVRINPDEVVALGAAIQANLLDRSRVLRPAPPSPRVEAASDAAPAQAVPDIPELPIVRGRGAAPASPHPAPLPRAVAPPRLPPPARERPEPAAIFIASLSPPPAEPAQFLPGASSRPLVFEPAPSAPGPPAPAPPPPKPPAPASSRREPPAPPPNERPRAPPPRRSPLLIDVTPLSLSVETVGGFCDTLIDANTPVPCDRTRSFATAGDGQTSVRVRVAQGESRRFAENTCLGELELTGLVAAERGKTQIDVTFEIDADGILDVRARDGVTGREINARIQLAGARSDAAEIDAMRARQAAHPLAGGVGAGG